MPSRSWFHRQQRKQAQFCRTHPWFSFALDPSQVSPSASSHACRLCTGRQRSDQPSSSRPLAATHAPTARQAMRIHPACHAATHAAASVVTNDVCLAARHDAQKMAGERLGARLQCDGAFDLAIDCAGTSDSMAQTVQLCKPGARVLMLATYWEGLTLPAIEVSMKELRLVNATTYCRHGMARDVDIAAALMARNPRIAESIITHRLPLEAAAEAFAIARNRAQGAIKVVLRP